MDLIRGIRLVTYSFSKKIPKGLHENIVYKCSLPTILFFTYHTVALPCIKINLWFASMHIPYYTVLYSPISFRLPSSGRKGRKIYELKVLLWSFVYIYKTRGSLLFAVWGPGAAQPWREHSLISAYIYPYHGYRENGLWAPWAPPEWRRDIQYVCILLYCILWIFAAFIKLIVAAAESCKGANMLHKMVRFLACTAHRCKNNAIEYQLCHEHSPLFARSYVDVPYSY